MPKQKNPGPPRTKLYFSTVNFYRLAICIIINNGEYHAQSQEATGAVRGELACDWPRIIRRRAKWHDTPCSRTISYHLKIEDPSVTSIAVSSVLGLAALIWGLAQLRRPPKRDEEERRQPSTAVADGPSSSQPATISAGGAPPAWPPSSAQQQQEQQGRQQPAAASTAAVDPVAAAVGRQLAGVGRLTISAPGVLLEEGSARELSEGGATLRVRPAGGKPRPSRPPGLGPACLTRRLPLLAYARLSSSTPAERRPRRRCPLLRPRRRPAGPPAGGRCPAAARAAAPALLRPLLAGARGGRRGRGGGAGARE